MNKDDLNFKILDHGYVRYVDHMGSDEQIVEAARMSTGKGFLGWYWEEDTYANCICLNCRTQHLYEDLPVEEDEYEAVLCTNCWSGNIQGFDTPNAPDWFSELKPKLMGKRGQSKDLNLLETLMANRHATPFEMGELVIEVKAPIMVFREWHRHRTQSYNEMSGRYIQMPNDHYVPPISRIQKQSTTNKQGSEGRLDPEYGERVREQIQFEQKEIYQTYKGMLEKGVAKEIARINTPVARYSRMRAKGNLRNWLGFLSLRMDLAAQWEIRQYAMAVAYIIKQLWPKAFDLWMKHEFLGSRFSQQETEVIRIMANLLQDFPSGIPWPDSFTEKQKTAFFNKLENKEGKYKDLMFLLENGELEEAL